MDRVVPPASRMQIRDMELRFFTQLHELTHQIQRGSDNPLGKLQEIYALADLVGELTTPGTACSKGCSRCCRVDLPITTIEARYIRKHVGIVPRTGSSISSGHTVARRPCPFLDAAGACSIYPFRPFVCRTLHAPGQPACNDIATPHARYGSRNNYILEKLFHLLDVINKRKPIRDIRDFFPLTTDPFP
ncbi:YkgJ family cysteine cluster protein [Chitiniphilus eburneus]|uniref:YkgJ family cysteine cluster protein n=1 Tax=Chitiniphilus eburneus TaxID=2571148 RepID=A0A4U0PUH1_9NEIS|nr:YkgJ family cysteine cluster protein [Chitiniphilus eburneus]TJZ72065.1 YkgJ family cysteine cluster protein [Chitiniphilus eburneus]